MKNALLLTGIWLAILVTAFSIVYWNHGVDQPLPISVLEQEPAAEVPVYSDPSLVLNVPVPDGWAVANEAATVRLSSPDGDVDVWIAPTDALDAETAFTQALEPTGIVIAWEDLDVAIADSPDASILAEIGYVGDSGSRIHGWLVSGDGPAAVVIAFGQSSALEAQETTIEQILEGVVTPELVPVLL